MKKLFALICGFALCLIVVGGAIAAEPVLFGGATTENGKVKLESSAAKPFSGIDFDVDAGTTFADLETLSAEYQAIIGDCGGGSPRFQINVDGRNVFVYFGPSPTFTGCGSAVQNTGNVVGTSDACRVDTSQFVGGTQCSTWADAVALLGSRLVTGIQIVVDSFWAVTGGNQTFLIDNVRINDTTYTFSARPTNASQCKKDGWMTFGELGFKNQGDCVSYVSTGGRNGPNG